MKPPGSFQNFGPKLTAMIMLLSLSGASWPRSVHDNGAGPNVVCRPRASAPSPIQDFVAHVVPSGVQLVWAVAHERDIEGFSVYRSEDGVAFAAINRDGLLEAYRHTLLDASVTAATTYIYALGVVLEDGSETFSQPVKVETPAKGSTVEAQSHRTATICRKWSTVGLSMNPVN